MVFKIEQDTLIKWKTLCNKSCRYYFIESRIVDFVFFWFFYDFISILQVHCLMRPGRQDLNVNFFIFRSYHQLDGRQAPIFLNFPIRHIFFWNFVFLNIKMKKSLECTPHAQHAAAGATSPNCMQPAPSRRGRSPTNNMQIAGGEKQAVSTDAQHELMSTFWIPSSCFASL